MIVTMRAAAPLLEKLLGLDLLSLTIVGVRLIDGHIVELELHPQGFDPPADTICPQYARIHKLGHLPQVVMRDPGWGQQ